MESAGRPASFAAMVTLWASFRNIAQKSVTACPTTQSEGGVRIIDNSRTQCFSCSNHKKIATVLMRGDKYEYIKFNGGRIDCSSAVRVFFCESNMVVITEMGRKK